MLTTWTVVLAPEAKSVDARTRFPLLIDQPVDAGEIDQLIPVPVGSGSLTPTLFAVPGPAFDTVTVKPIGFPAETVAASAVLVIERLGHWTTIDAWAGDGAVPFPNVAVAVFGIVPHELPDVVATM